MAQDDPQHGNKNTDSVEDDFFQSLQHNREKQARPHTHTPAEAPLPVKKFPIGKLAIIVLIGVSVAVLIYALSFRSPTPPSTVAPATPAQDKKPPQEDAEPAPEPRRVDTPPPSPPPRDDRRYEQDPPAYEPPQHETPPSPPRYDDDPSPPPMDPENPIYPDEAQPSDAPYE
jgi:hypothetical protein